MKSRTPSKRCHCPRCKLTQRLERITAKLPKRDANFILDLHDAFIELSAEAELREEAQKN